MHTKHSALMVFDFVFFAFFLHFFWELIQMPLFSGFKEAYYYAVILHCLQATGGDVVISLLAVFVASMVTRSLEWTVGTNRAGVFIFFLTGLVITIIFELLATGPLDRWVYGTNMPNIPIINVGISPVAQWIVIPFIQLWYIKRLFN